MEFNVAPATIGNAIAALRDEGYVTTVVSVGSYVAPSESWPEKGKDSQIGETK